MTGNKFVKVYRDALDCWLKKKLTGSEWTVLMYLASATWGWHRASTKKSLAEVANEIGSTRRQVLRAIKGLEKAGLVMFEGEERRKHVFKLRPPEEYTEFEAKLVTQMTPVEAKSIQTENLVTFMAKTGDINDTNLVTCPDTKVLSPYKPLRKKERKKERDYDFNSSFKRGVNPPLEPPGDVLEGLR